MPALLRILVILLWMQNAFALKENQDWELAVAVFDQIQLLSSEGIHLGSTVNQFSKLKALTFDSVRHRFVVSNQGNYQNDTIFTVQLTKETEITPIVPDLSDDVVGLAMDPIEDVLYWTDSQSKTINYVSLNDSEIVPKTFLEFSSVVPHDVAIDVCNRYIYWTNSNLSYPTIERSLLNGSNHEVIVSSYLNIPAGIAIDYKSQKIYWADMGEGIYYRIERANFTGGDREIVYRGTHAKPFGIAVDEQAVYWTDTNNNALWRYFKSDKGSVPERIRNFDERPLGLVAKNVQIRHYPDCEALETALETYGDKEAEYFEPTLRTSEQGDVLECLNGGELIDGKFCECPKGFTGPYCEVENCHNFCVHGTCHLSLRGYPLCHCYEGFGGDRCELNMCKGFCLNGGHCSYNKGDLMATCDCDEKYTGSRCEISTDFSNLCAMYCQESVNRDDFLISKDRDKICRCEKDSFNISKNNNTAHALRAHESHFYHRNFMEKLTLDKDYLIFLSLTACSILSTVILSVVVCLIKRRRPKRPIIRKKFILKGNVQPLRYSPRPAADQCEITIENCCNMNVCETPCFEPTILNTTKEDKKTLLSSMEDEEECY